MLSLINIKSCFFWLQEKAQWARVFYLRLLFLSQAINCCLQHQAALEMLEWVVSKLDLKTRQVLVLIK